MLRLVILAGFFLSKKNWHMGVCFCGKVISEFSAQPCLTEWRPSAMMASSNTVKSALSLAQILWHIVRDSSVLVTRDNVSQGPINSNDWQKLKAVWVSDVAQTAHTKIARAFSKTSVWLLGFMQLHSAQFFFFFCANFQVWDTRQYLHIWQTMQSNSWVS